MWTAVAFWAVAVEMPASPSQLPAAFCVVSLPAEQVWPKICQNLRSARQTELEESLPSHVVGKWFGNPQMVAAQHYSEVTEEHYAKAAQIPAQYAPVTPGKGQERTKGTSAFSKEYGALRCRTNNK